MDKYKDIGILLENCGVLHFPCEVVKMAVSNPELLSNVYKEISEELGMDVAIGIYRIFKGQQVCFPVRLFNPEKIKEIIVKEYDGTNIRLLAKKYDYSEKSVYRMIKESLENN